MRRGEVWLAELPKPVGLRPVVLLSRDEAYKVRNAVTVAEITTTIRGIPVEVRLGREDGLSKECMINLDTILTIRKSLLKKYICSLSQEKIEGINKAIRFALSLN